MLIQRKFTCGSFEIREITFTEAFDVLPGHTHNFMHLSMVRKGSVKARLWVKTGEENGVPIWHSMMERELTAGSEYDCFECRAEDMHEIVALSDGAVLWCMFPHRDAITGEISEHYTGFEAAYV